MTKSSLGDRFIANSMVLLRFVTWVAVAFAFCVADAILYRSVSRLACRFYVAQTTASSIFVAGAAFCHVAKALFS